MSQPQGQGSPQTLGVKSGPEIVADFIETAKNNQELDQATVTAIDGLFRANRLSTTNLLKRLDELRGESKV